MRVTPVELEARDGRAYAVREARPGEAGALLDLSWLVHSREPEVTVREPDEFRLSADHMRGFVKALAEAPNSLFLVAAAGREVVGTLTVQGGRERKLRHDGELGLLVHPDWRRIGVGRSLLTAGLRPEVLDLRRVTLRVFAGNEAAIRLYASFGFREEGRRRGHVRLGDRYVDEILMAYELETR